MSESVRSFLAFDIDSEEVTRKLARMQKFSAETGADLKLVEPENIHVTLRFLGDINLNMVERVFAVMKRVEFSPFDIHLVGLGVFPSLNFPRVLWAGIAQGADELKNVASQLETGLRDLGFAPDSKGFSPHLTIARVRSGRNKVQLADFVKKNDNYDFGSINANCLRLKKSVLSPRGPTYSTLKEHCPK
jgi:2'-5' RNA ligase